MGSISNEEHCPVHGSGGGYMGDMGCASGAEHAVARWRHYGGFYGGAQELISPFLSVLY